MSGFIQRVELMNWVERLVFGAIFTTVGFIEGVVVNFWGWIYPILKSVSHTVPEFRPPEDWIVVVFSIIAGVMIAVGGYWLITGIKMFRRRLT